MNWFAKKDKGPTPEELAAEEERLRREAAEAELRRKITLALDKEPAFQVVTVDGVNWICPFTFTLVPAAFGFVEPARDYLFEKQPWKQAKQHTAQEVLVQRWTIHLKANLEFEPRLRIFGPDQRWLNPYSGQWVKLPVRPGSPPQQILEAVAGALAASAEATKGQLLDVARLREIEQRVLRDQGGGAPDTAAVGATKRVSGKAGESSADIGAGDDLSRAKGILDRMLSEMPDIPGFGISVHYEPHAEVGGDFFACLPLGGDRQLLLVADVAGHGVQGALVVVAALKALRFIVKETQELVEILALLNDSVKSDLLAGQFITCWAGILSPAERRLEMACAGHHGVGIANPTAEVALRRISAKGPALGLMSSAIFRKALKTVTIELAPGDTLMQCTDGLEEASDPHREEFGELRTLGSLLGCCDLPHDEIVDRIAADGRRWAAGTYQDDVTVMVVQCEPPAPPAVETGENQPG